MKNIKQCLLIPILLFFGCNNSTNFNNDLPMKKVSVQVDFKNQYATLNIDVHSDLNNVALYSKSNNSRKVKNLIVGDHIEVYYTDASYAEIDHILVDEASYLSIKAEKRSVPGDIENNYIDLYVENKLGEYSIYLDYTKHEVYNILNKDGTYTKIKEVVDGAEIYGVYREEENIVTTPNSKVYYLIALYSYEPRV